MANVVPFVTMEMDSSSSLVSIGDIFTYIITVRNGDINPILGQSTVMDQYQLF